MTDVSTISFNLILKNFSSQSEIEGSALAFCILNYKFQASNDKQIPNFKHQIPNKAVLSLRLLGFLVLFFGHSRLFVICHLKFGA